MTQLVPDIPPPMQPLTLERNRKLIEVPEVVEDRIGDHLRTGKHRLSRVFEFLLVLVFIICMFLPPRSVLNPSVLIISMHMCVYIGYK